MTNQSDPQREMRFVRTVLPWLVVLAGMIVYLLTLNRWVSIYNMRQVARSSGWIWTPDVTGPFYFLVTYPFSWLPASWVPMALNLFSALCGALTLGLLARSVVLLPHDRTHEQRQREQSDFALLSTRTAWMPPVLAAVVCGLTLTIWETATTGYMEMFELLLLAYTIRCLLEFRVSQRDSWLFRGALVYGAAMTDNWVMIGLLPAFLASMLWMKGLSFFNLRFLGRVLGCGVVGLMLYLLLPAIYVMSDNATANFWQVLKPNLQMQKSILQGFCRTPSFILLLFSFASFVPVLLISIKWASYFGDPSRLGILITTSILHLAHAFLLGFCIWVAFDPVFSARSKGAPIPALYYLSALSVGYFAGYFLLVFTPIEQRMRRAPLWQLILHRCVQTVICLLLVIVSIGLVYRNIGQIRMTNGPAMKEYATRLTRNLPERGVIVCDSEDMRSDTPRKLWLTQAWLAGRGRAKDYIFVDATGMGIPSYHGFQRKRYPEWPTDVDPRAETTVNPAFLIKVIVNLSTNRPVYYLHHSFGYYFEYFQPRPHGLVCELHPYGTNVILGTPLPAQLIASNQEFWSENAESIDDLLPFIRKPVINRDSPLKRKLMQKLHIEYKPNITAILLGTYYSQALNLWGGELQKVERWADAGEHFKRALDLNADNISAKINLQFNRDMQAGHHPVLKPTRLLEDEFGKFRDWQQVLREVGPFDEPTHCYGQGVVFVQGRNLRQGALQFERVRTLVPDNLEVRMTLAQLYLMAQLPERTLEVVSEIRSRPEISERAGLGKYDLLQLEVAALLAAERKPEAEKMLADALDQNPKDEMLLGEVVQVFMRLKLYTNALDAVERQLILNPQNTEALVNKGYCQIQLGDYERAIPALTSVLTLGTNSNQRLDTYYKAHLNRAIALLGCNKLEEAQHDYESLQKVFPTAYPVYYGLGEIAWRQKNTNAAIRNYELYLTNSVADSDEAKLVAERLTSLRSTSP